MLDICLLGTGGTMPLPGRWLTSMIASYKGRMTLMDCGEGTQITLKMLGWGFKAIETICFTHYHADHVAGLPGMLLAIGNAGRTEPLTIMGPPGVFEVVRGLTVIAPYLPYDIKMTEVSIQRQTTRVNEGFHLHTLPVQHTVPCLAYCIEIERGRKFNPQQAQALAVPVPLWKTLQKGEEVVHEGETVTPDMVLGPPRRGIKVCYCTDTRPVEPLVSFIEGADLFICEGMYGEDGFLEKAEEHGHMLFSEAASLAQRGGVKELWLTHYSPSLTEPEQYIGNARVVFPNSFLGEERMTKHLAFQN
ncbi:ribonuclease Z [Aneurinibacillus tyrosinisolvens]|uniref:ribonuclease Z n=1 Tax=Aneurinibacillus tyrosinisolvens TaxID=1443435 RepID=UPI00063F5DBD|nr:ribonuclease Z [Aneurinibacillus tyrosinisolvens]